MRNVEVPYLLNMYYRREAFLHAFANRSFENARRVQDDVRSVENNRKRYDGYLAALVDPEIWRSIEQREKKVRDAMSANANLKGALAAYDRIQKAQEATAKILPVYNYFESFPGRQTATSRSPRAFYSTLFKYARRLLRAADEMPKPNGERFHEFSKRKKNALTRDIFS